MNIPYPEETTIGRFLGNPLVKFGYGVYFFSMGIIYWQFQILSELGLLGIGITGFLLMIGFFYIGSYYDDFKKTLQNNPTVSRN